MNIAFVTEMNTGRLPKNFKDFSTVMSWVYGFNAININYSDIEDINYKDYDLFIVIISKKNPGICGKIIDVLPLDKVAVLQEGPCYHFQDLSADNLIKYERLLKKCKFILCHNERDVSYFKQFNYSLRMPTCSDTKIKVGEIEKQRVGLIFGTNCSWYNGQTSYSILKTTGLEIYMPMMGRFKKDESKITLFKGIKVLKYLPWRDFVEAIKNTYIACHMMPTMAASSYAIICAILGIPCICSPSDVSKDLFPYTTCRDAYDYEMGTLYADRLMKDKEFYDKVVEHAKLNVAKYDYRLVCKKMEEKFEKILYQNEKQKQQTQDNYKQ